VLALFDRRGRWGGAHEGCPYVPLRLRRAGLQGRILGWPATLEVAPYWIHSPALFLLSYGHHNLELVCGIEPQSPVYETDALPIELRQHGRATGI
jgi:hypothetical protein